MFRFRESLGRFSQGFTWWLLNVRRHTGRQDQKPDLHHPAGLSPIAPELRERGATKLAHLADALAGALEQRDVGPAHAFLAASCGIAVLSQVRREWLENPHQDYKTLLTDAFADINQLIGDQSS